jgi:hypothetical protein
VSSAKRSDRRSLQKGRSLMYSKKRSGPRIEPWGTPVNMYISKLSLLSILLPIREVTFKPKKFRSAYGKLWKFFQYNCVVTRIKSLLNPFMTTRNYCNAKLYYQILAIVPLWTILTCRKGIYSYVARWANQPAVPIADTDLSTAGK